MLSAPMIDPLGSIITELRADVDLDLLVHDRIRGEEAGPNDVADPYQAFVVLVTFEDPPHPRVPIQRAVYGVNAYGVTYQNARAVWGAVVKAMHIAGSRMKSNGLGIYISAVEGGGEADEDPQTHQPLIRGVIRVTATAAAIT